MPLLQLFKHHFEGNFAQFSGQPLLLAVSGGMDSMVMGHLFHAIGQPFAVAHCNFGLRGDESDMDADFVQSAAKKWGATFFIKHFDTKTYAQEKGISTQMAARILRYDWFHEICARHHYAAVVTAHHLNDAAETVILNLVRGKGLYSLKGIAAISPYSPEQQTDAIQVLRPLLSFPHTRIADYAKEQGISWREDSSNKEDKYTRNQIRHHVVPIFEALNPAFLSVMEKNTQRISGLLDNYKYLISQYLGKNSQIEKSRLTSLPNIEQALFSRLHPLGFNEEQVRQIAGNLEHVGLVIQGEDGWYATVERNHIALSNHAKSVDFSIQISADDLMVSLPDQQRLFIMPSSDTQPYPDGTAAVVVDANLLSYPLSVRYWQAGDVFQPFGMQGQHQKLQDYLTNKKISNQDKNQVMLLLNGDGRVIWVIKHRLDERYKVTQNSTNAMIIRIL